MKGIVGCILIISACAIVVNVDEVNAITVSSRDHLDIVVTSNPSTGYSWVWSSESSEDLKVQNGYYGEFLQPEVSMPGAPGRQLFHVNVDAFEGDTLSIVLKYMRPWEELPIQVKKIQVNIASKVKLE